MQFAMPDVEPSGAYMLLKFVMFAYTNLFVVSTLSGDALSDADSIRNLEDQWSMAIKVRDIDKIVGFFASEAVSMTTNKPICVGLDSIRKREQASFSDTTNLYETYSSTIDNVEVSASNDLAYARGSDRLSQNTKNGKAIEVGKWVDIWKKADGKWIVVVSIWNNDNPTPK